MFGWIRKTPPQEPSTPAPKPAKMQILGEGTITLRFGTQRRPTGQRRYKLPDGRVHTEFRSNARPSRGFGRCGYCGHSWDQVESFTFSDPQTGSGFFPVCIGCWLELRTFNERGIMREILQETLDMWRSQGESRYTLAKMERIVEPYWELPAPALGEQPEQPAADADRQP